MAPKLIAFVNVTVFRKNYNDEFQNNNNDKTRVAIFLFYFLFSMFGIIFYVVSKFYANFALEVVFFYYFCLCLKCRLFLFDDIRFKNYIAIDNALQVLLFASLFQYS